MMPLRAIRLFLLGLLLAAAGTAPCLAQLPPGYRDYAAFVVEVDRLASEPSVERSSLGETADGREIVLLTVRHESANAERIPAILFVGAAEADCLAASHLSLAIAERLSQAIAKSEPGDPLREVAFYFVPRPSPDASEWAFASPLDQRATNRRPRDDDRDGEVDEDPAEDLNGDGLITMMRVADPAGDYRPHPDEPRLMVKVDRTKGEHGVYRLLIEGVDNDHDEQWNEDRPGGVEFNRNFTFRYPYFKPGAGPHQVSEIETRALADFAFDHPNIFAVVSISSVDTLNHPQKAKPDEGKIKRSIQKSDAEFLRSLTQPYREAVDGTAAPPKDEGEGAFANWAYFHFGRWSLSTRAWWPTGESEGDKVGDEEGKEEGKDEEKQDSAAGAEADPEVVKSKAGSEQPDGDARAEQERRLLRWLDEQDQPAFVDWTPVEHPDFPSQSVEVGGFKPYVRENPPLDSLDPEPLAELLQRIAAQRACVKILKAEVEELGQGVVRVTAKVTNQGRLPTACTMGRIAGRLRRLEVELRGADPRTLLTGPRRQDVGVLAPGEVSEHQWLLRVPKGTDLSELTLRVGEPSIGFAEAKVAPTGAEGKIKGTKGEDR